MKVAIYTRVSTKDQSCQIQSSELRAYAEKRGFIIFKEYVDVVTGAVEKRKKVSQYDLLMEDAKLGKFDCVLVWKFDRFARSVLHLSMAFEEFKKLGIDFISMSESDFIDTTSPMGKAMFQMVAIFAELERSIIVERTRRGLQLVKDTGYNAKGEAVTLGRPEEISQEQKDNIISDYLHEMPLLAISKLRVVPFGTVYSIITRSVLPCAHGKYRCKRCRKLGWIPVRLTSGNPEISMESNSRSLP